MATEHEDQAASEFDLSRLVERIHQQIDRNCSKALHAVGTSRARFAGRADGLAEALQLICNEFEIELPDDGRLMLSGENRAKV